MCKTTVWTGTTGDFCYGYTFEEVKGIGITVDDIRQISLLLLSFSYYSHTDSVMTTFLIC